VPIITAGTNFGRAFREPNESTSDVHSDCGPKRDPPKSGRIDRIHFAEGA
jgi:hypothetical protein